MNGMSDQACCCDDTPLIRQLLYVLPLISAPFQSDSEQLSGLQQLRHRRPGLRAWHDARWFGSYPAAHRLGSHNPLEEERRLAS